MRCGIPTTTWSQWISIPILQRREALKGCGCRPSIGRARACSISREWRGFPPIGLFASTPKIFGAYRLKFPAIRRILRALAKPTRHSPFIKKPAIGARITARRDRSKSSGYEAFCRGQAVIMLDWRSLNELSMDLNQLEYFLRVAELGSINRAAKELGLSQPALSR